MRLVMKNVNVALILILFFSCGLTALDAQPVVEQTIIEQPMAIIIASYKNANYYKGNLDSVFNQHYTNYRVIYISDNDYAADSDGTGELVQKYVTEKNQWHRFTLVRNHKRHLALRNLYRALLSLKDEEIAVFLDGDDEFAHNNVLARVNEMYSDSAHEVWYTYGDYTCSSIPACSYTTTIPKYVIQNNVFRAWSYMATHLRTCKAWLAHQIIIDDLFYDNDMYKMTYDVALYEPMMEMAGERYAWTREILYKYKDDTSLNDHSVNWFLQMFLSQRIRAKTPYVRLEANLSHQLEQRLQNGKADVVIFSYNAQKLRQILQDIQIKFSSVGSVVAVYQASSERAANVYKTLMGEFPAVTFIPWPEGEPYIGHFMAQCMKSDAAYVILMDDRGVIAQRDIKDAIRWLELTHANSFYLNLPYARSSTATCALELTLDEAMPQTVYAFRHVSVLSLLDFAAQGLYRKSDVMPRFKEWKFKLGYLPFALQDMMSRGGVSLLYHE